MTKYGSYTNEYLTTNTQGTYTSSNYLFGNTRKYHGLLVANIGELTKYNILNRLEEEILIKQNVYSLSTNIYQGDIVSPQGHLSLKSFKMNPMPTWEYVFDDLTITKRILLDDFKNLVTIKYSISSKELGILRVKPLISLRDIHKVKRFENQPSLLTEEKESGIKIQLDEQNYIFATATKIHFTPKDEVYFNFYYPDEKDRGYESIEDLNSPGFFDQVFLPGNCELTMRFTINQDFISMPTTEVPAVSISQQNPLEKKHHHDIEPLNKLLFEQSKQFLVSSISSSGIIAGYHWFDQWSRDTFISLHGLCLSKKDFAFAKEVLESWGKYLEDGLLPNRLSVRDKLNSIDSIFWFAIRLYELSQMTNDYDLAEKLLNRLENVLIQFEKASNAIHITKKGFLYDENSTEAMTWMDAKVDGKPIIDRSGSAVEIQALWYNYVRIMIILKEKFNDRTYLTRLKEIKILLERNFEKEFWNKATNCLFDSVIGDLNDSSIRPNQIIPVYLPFNLLGNRKSKMILATIERKLLTPLGLRTLAREDEKYHPDYSGNQSERDYSYHQGTVWPYLLGFYLIAYLKTYHYSESSKKYVYEQLVYFQDKLQEKNLRYVPEIFSAESLEPNGCLSQAWSVATLLETIYHLSSINDKNVH